MTEKPLYGIGPAIRIFDAILVNEHGKPWACSHPGAISFVDNHICNICHPEKKYSEDLYICRKIQYGNNGNFVRYEPIHPQRLNKKSFLARLVVAWKKGAFRI